MSNRKIKSAVMLSYLVRSYTHRYAIQRKFSKHSIMKVNRIPTFRLNLEEV